MNGSKEQPSCVLDLGFSILKYLFSWAHLIHFSFRFENHNINYD